jgi:hypothetical protein
VSVRGVRWTVSRILEAELLTGYPEGQLPTPMRARHPQGKKSQEEKFHHGCAEAENVAFEHP